MRDLGLNDFSHLLHSVVDCVDVFCAGKCLLELWDCILGRYFCSLGFEAEEGVDVKTGERFLCFALAFTAFGLWWNCITECVGQ